MFVDGKRQNNAQNDIVETDKMGCVKLWYGIVQKQVDMTLPHEQSMMLLKLKKVAIIALACAATPATSAPSERVFSKLNWYDAPRRCNFKHERLCYMLVVGAWADMIGRAKALDVVRVHLQRMDDEEQQAAVGMQSEVDDLLDQPTQQVSYSAFDLFA